MTNKEYLKRFGFATYIVRLSLNLTPSEFAAKLKISVLELEEIETGYQWPEACSHNVVFRIGEAIGKTYFEFQTFVEATHASTASITRHLDDVTKEFCKTLKPIRYSLGLSLSQTNQAANKLSGFTDKVESAAHRQSFNNLYIYCVALKKKDYFESWVNELGSLVYTSVNAVVPQINREKISLLIDVDTANQVRAKLLEVKNKKRMTYSDIIEAMNDSGITNTTYVHNCFMKRDFRLDANRALAVARCLGVEKTIQDIINH